MLFIRKYKIRPLLEKDLIKISEWILSDAKNGNLLQLYQEPQYINPMINAMRENIYGQPFKSFFDGKYEERLGTVWIYENRKNVIGYALLYEKEPGSINSDIEIKLFHIDEKVQRHGHATRFMSLLEKRLTGKMNFHVECLPNSIGMMSLLEKINYKIVSISPHGKKTYKKEFG